MKKFFKENLAAALICGTVLGSTVFLAEAAKDTNRMVYNQKISALLPQYDGTKSEKIAALSELFKKAQLARKSLFWAEKPETIIFYSNAVITQVKRIQEKESYKDFNLKEKKQLIELKQKAEKYRHETIVENYLPVLENHLKNREIGYVGQENYIRALSRMSHDASSLDAPGAVDATRELLLGHPHRSYSVDLNENGYVDSGAEVDLIPCEGIVEIEKLWRKYTNDRCGWFGVNSVYDNLQCTELAVETTESIYDLNDKKIGEVALPTGGALFSLLFPTSQDPMSHHSYYSDITTKINSKFRQCLHSQVFESLNTTPSKKLEHHSSSLAEKVDKIFKNGYRIFKEAKGIKTYVGKHYLIQRHSEKANSLKVTYKWDNKVIIENSQWNPNIDKSERERFLKFLDDYSQVLENKPNLKTPLTRDANPDISLTPQTLKLEESTLSQSSDKGTELKKEDSRDSKLRKRLSNLDLKESWLKLYSEAPGSPLQATLSATTAALKSGYSKEIVKKMIIEYDPLWATHENIKAKNKRADLIINKATYLSSSEQKDFTQMMHDRGRNKNKEIETEIEAEIEY